MKKNLLILTLLCCVSFITESPISALTEKQKVAAELIGGTILMLGGGIGCIYFNTDQNRIIDAGNPLFEHLKGREHIRRTFFTVEHSGYSPWGLDYYPEKRVNWESLCAATVGAGGFLLFLKGIYDLGRLNSQEKKGEESEESEDPVE